MADNLSHLDADRFHVPGSNIYRALSNCHIDVYNSQFNIAQLIHQHALNLKIIHHNDSFETINAFFLGPTFTDLKHQTASDLLYYSRQINLWDLANREISNDNCKIYIDNMVVNSSALKEPTYNQLHFVKNLIDDDSQDKLHVLVHDEAHWGANENSNINKFLNYVYNILREKHQSHQPAKVLILLVTATNQLFRSVELNVVDWNCYLNPPHPAFHTPTYRSVDELNFVNDGRDIMLNCETLTERSAVLVDDYLSAVDKVLAFCTINTSHAKRHECWSNFTYTDHAVMSLICDTSQDGWNIPSSENIGKYVENSPRNVMVFVRFQVTEDADRLKCGVLNLFRRYSIWPFEVVVATSKSGSIQEQFSHQAQTILHKKYKYVFGNLNQSDYVVKDITDIPILFIVVDKVQMGERLPPSCLTFDLRARYKGNYNNVKNSNESTFIQDAGRCAGHKASNKMPTILMALEGVGSGAVGNIPNFKLTHAEVRVDQSPTVKNAQHDSNSQIYSKLKPFTLTLKAEPQIGKTGVCLALLEILFSRHVRDSRVQEVSRQPLPPPVSHTTHRNHTEFADLCSELRDMVAKHGIQYLWDYMSKPNGNFDHYHQLLNGQRQNDPHNNDTNAYIVDLYLARLFSGDNSNYRIADCGCGKNGITSSIAKMFRDDMETYNHIANVQVHGFDLHDNLLDTYISEDEKHFAVSFTGHVCDMNIRDDIVMFAAAPFDIVIYNCSMYEKSCGKYLEWAWDYLNNNGHLVLVNLSRRMPQDKQFAALMEQMGWSKPKMFNQLYINKHSTYHYSLWQKKDGRVFNSSYDLELSN